MIRPATLIRFCQGLLTRQIYAQRTPLLNKTRSLIIQNKYDFISLFGLSSHRSYEKGKDKLKESKGKKKKNIEVNDTFLAEAIDIDKYKSDLEQALNNMKDTYIKQISLRSTTGSIENLLVVVEGKKYTLIELGQIIRKNPKTIVINMSSFPQAIPNVLKAIAGSGMNLNPQQDGTSLFIPVPKVTREHREGLAKNAKAHYIKCRDNMRNIQNKSLKTIKNKSNEGLSDDDCFRMSEQVKHIADQYVQQAEKLFQTKEVELLGDT